MTEIKRAWVVGYDYQPQLVEMTEYAPSPDAQPRLWIKPLGGWSWMLASEGSNVSETEAQAVQVCLERCVAAVRSYEAEAKQAVKHARELRKTADVLAELLKRLES